MSKSSPRLHVHVARVHKRACGGDQLVEVGDLAGERRVCEHAVLALTHVLVHLPNKEGVPRDRRVVAAGDLGVRSQRISLRAP